MNQPILFASPLLSESPLIQHQHCRRDGWFWKSEWLLILEVWKKAHSLSLDRLRCTPHKLRHLIIIIASSKEIALPWGFSCACGLPLCWCWWFFIILRQNFCMASFLARKKRCLLPYKHLLFFAIARHKKSSVLGWWKIVSISKEAKNFRVLQFLWRMQLQIQHTPVNIESSCLCTVPEERGEFHDQEDVGCH